MPAPSFTFVPGVIVRKGRLSITGDCCTLKDRESAVVSGECESLLSLERPDPAEDRVKQPSETGQHRNWGSANFKATETVQEPGQNPKNMTEGLQIAMEAGEQSILLDLDSYLCSALAARQDRFGKAAGDR